MGLFDFRRAAATETPDLPGQVPDLTVVRDETVFEESRRAALRSGLLEEEERRLAPEREFVGEIAIATGGCAPWDPDANPADALAEARKERALHRREELMTAICEAERQLRERELDLADLGVEPVGPVLSRTALAVLGTLALLPAFCLGLYGFLSVAAPGHALALAVLPAAALAALVCGASVGTAPTLSDGRRLRAVVGVAVVISWAIAAGVNSGPLGRQGAGSAWAAGALVFALTVLVELTATWLQGALFEHNAAIRPFRAAAARVGQATRDLALRRDELGDVQREIDQHDALVTQRTSTHLSGLEHAEAARRTAEAGASRGIHEQDGWAWTGIRRPPQVDRMRARYRGEPRKKESDR